VLDVTHAGLVAERFGLGKHVRLAGPVAFGRLGEIWQLVTDHGRFAVKHAKKAILAEDAECDAAYQDLVRRAGVPMPVVVPTVDGKSTTLPRTSRPPSTRAATIRRSWLRRSGLSLARATSASWRAGSG
jgi:hypothetical protein